MTMRLAAAEQEDLRPDSAAKAGNPATTRAQDKPRSAETQPAHTRRLCPRGQCASSSKQLGSTRRNNRGEQRQHDGMSDAVGRDVLIPADAWVSVLRWWRWGGGRTSWRRSTALVHARTPGKGWCEPAEGRIMALHCMHACRCHRWRAPWRATSSNSPRPPSGSPTAATRCRRPRGPHPSTPSCGAYALQAAQLVPQETQHHQGAKDLHLPPATHAGMCGRRSSSTPPGCWTRARAPRPASPRRAHARRPAPGQRRPQRQLHRRRPLCQSTQPPPRAGAAPPAGGARPPPPAPRGPPPSTRRSPPLRRPRRRPAGPAAAAHPAREGAGPPAAPVAKPPPPPPPTRRRRRRSGRPRRPPRPPSLCCATLRARPAATASRSRTCPPRRAASPSCPGERATQVVSWSAHAAQALLGANAARGARLWCPPRLTLYACSARRISGWANLANFLLFVAVGLPAVLLAQQVGVQHLSHAPPPWPLVR